MQALKLLSYMSQMSNIRHWISLCFDFRMGRPLLPCKVQDFSREHDLKTHD